MIPSANVATIDGEAKRVLDVLASLPTPKVVLALRPSPQLRERLEALLGKNRSTGFSPADQREWDQYQYVERLVRIAKISAARKLSTNGR